MQIKLTPFLREVKHGQQGFNLRLVRLNINLLSDLSNPKIFVKILLILK